MQDTPEPPNGARKRFGLRRRRAAFGVSAGGYPGAVPDAAFSRAQAPAWARTWERTSASHGGGVCGAELGHARSPRSELERSERPIPPMRNCPKGGGGCRQQLHFGTHPERQNRADATCRRAAARRPRFAGMAAAAASNLRFVVRGMFLSRPTPNSDPRALCRTALFQRQRLVRPQINGRRAASQYPGGVLPVRGVAKLFP